MTFASLKKKKKRKKGKKGKGGNHGSRGGPYSRLDFFSFLTLRKGKKRRRKAC